MTTYDSAFKDVDTEPIHTTTTTSAGRTSVTTIVKDAKTDKFIDIITEPLPIKPVKYIEKNSVTGQYIERTVLSDGTLSPNTTPIRTTSSTTAGRDSVNTIVKNAETGQVIEFITKPLPADTSTPTNKVGAWFVNLWKNINRPAATPVPPVDAPVPEVDEEQNRPDNPPILPNPIKKSNKSPYDPPALNLLDNSTWNPRVMPGTGGKYYNGVNCGLAGDIICASGY